MKLALSDLRARVEAARGPDRELDVDLALFFWKPTADYTRARKPIISDFGLGTFEEVGFSGFHVCRADFFTASIDAVVSLIERLMPGVSRQVGFFPDLPSRRELGLKRAEGRVWIPSQVTQGWQKENFAATADTEPLALLAAFLAALEAQETHNARD